MKELLIKQYVRYVFMLTILTFILNRFYLRPLVLETTLPNQFKVLVFSFPNFAEAVIGCTLITGILFQLRHNFARQFSWLHSKLIYASAFMLAGAYSLSQEFNLHSIGGNNVFDSNDVYATILGLITTLGIFLKFGFLKNN